MNQNNQNQIGTGFLRSNDPRVIALSQALHSLGWYLERREGEVASFDDGERAKIEKRLGHSLDRRVIRLKQGAQAYAATFFGAPETAKKNVKRIFTSVDDGGSFERIFSSDMTADKIIIAHKLMTYVDGFVRQFSTRKRRRERVENWQSDYAEILGNRIIDEFGEKVNQVMPQSVIFLCATIFRDFCEFQGNNPAELPEFMEVHGDDLIREHIYFIMRFAEDNQHQAGKSWPVLLKSNSFFQSIASYIQGIRASASMTSKQSI